MRFVLPLLILAALCWWFGLEPVAQALAHASARGLVLYLLLSALVVLGYAVRWRMVADAVGARAPLGQLVAARLAGDAVSALVPSGRLAGEPIRVALVRDRGSTAKATAGVAIDRVLEVIGNMLAVIAYVAVFCSVRGAGSAGRAPLLLAAMMALLLVATATLVVRWRRGRQPLAWLYGARARRLVPRFEAWMDGLRRVEKDVGHFFTHHPRAFAFGVLGSLIIEAITILQYHALMSAFGIQLDLPTLLLVLLAGGAAHAVPVPAALGTLEVAQVAVVGAAAGRPDLGFAVGVIVRLHETLLLGLGLGVLSYEGVSLARLRLASPRAGA
jgi:uncharacterized protein (TIRG00374 family)